MGPRVPMSHPSPNSGGMWPGGHMGGPGGGPGGPMGGPGGGNVPMSGGSPNMGGQNMPIGSPHGQMQGSPRNPGKKIISSRQGDNCNSSVYSDFKREISTNDYKICILVICINSFYTHRRPKSWFSNDAPSRRRQISNPGEWRWRARRTRWTRRARARGTRRPGRSWRGPSPWGGWNGRPAAAAAWDESSRHESPATAATHEPTRHEPTSQNGRLSGTQSKFKV